MFESGLRDPITYYGRDIQSRISPINGDENAGTGDRSDMRKQGIGENTGTGDRSATDIFVGYR